MTTKTITLDLGVLGDVDFEVDFDYFPAWKSNDRYQPSEPEEVCVNDVLPLENITLLAFKHIQESDMFFENVCNEYRDARHEAEIARSEARHEALQLSNCER